MKTTKFLTILFALIIGAAIDASAQGGNTIEPTSSGTNQWTFTMPDGDVRVQATYENEPYFILTDNDPNDASQGQTLTFYYDNKKPDGAVDINLGNARAAWLPSNSTVDLTSVTKVTFDESFANAEPTSCRYLFCTQTTTTTNDQKFSSKLKTIEGLNYLKTDNVTDMYGMFNGSYVENLDLSSFNTTKVTDMGYMFNDCYSLKTIGPDAEGKSEDGTFNFGTNFSTASVTDMSCMFSDCKQLISIDLSKFNTERVTRMFHMFNGCSNLQSLDLSNFNTESVTNMSYMFNNCFDLETLTFGDDFNTSSVTDMSNMFSSCGFKSIDLSGFDTRNVTNIESMFNSCKSLETIILGGNFSAESVTTDEHDYYFGAMFGYCPRLTTIVVPDVYDMNIPNGVKGVSMFADDKELIGGQGTIFDENKIEKEYARIDNPNSDAPGYFTVAGNYLIKYDLNDNNTNTASLEDPVTTYDGNSDVTLPTPTRPGYTFKGWYRVNSEDNDWYKENDKRVYATTIAADSIGNRRYKAEWEQNKYKVVIANNISNLNIENAASDNLYTYNTKITVKPSTGYTITSEVKYSYKDEANNDLTVTANYDNQDGYTFNVPLTAPDEGEHNGYIGTITVSATVKKNQTITTAEIAALISATKTYDGGCWANASDDKYYNPYNTDPALLGTTMLMYVNDQVTPNETVYFSVTAKYVKATTDDATGETTYTETKNVTEANAIEVEVLGENAFSLDAEGNMSQLKNYTFAASDAYPFVSNTSKFYITDGVKINAQELSINIQGSISKTYDGTVVVADFLTKNTPTITSGKIEGDDVSIASAKFDNAEVGWHEDGVTITLGGEDAANYVAGKSSGTITGISATLTAGLGANIQLSAFPNVAGLTGSADDGINITSKTEGSNTTYYLTTTANATTTSESTTTLEIKDAAGNKVGDVNVTIKDYAKDLFEDFDGEWKSENVRIYPAQIEQSTTKISVGLASQDEPSKTVTSPKDINWTVYIDDTELTENTDISSSKEIVYQLNDQNNDIYSRNTISIKIDKDAPSSPCLEYTDTDGTLQTGKCGAGLNETPPTVSVIEGTEITLYSNDAISGVAKIFYTGKENEEGEEPTSYNPDNKRYEYTYTPTVGVYTLKLNAEDFADNKQSQDMYLNLTVYHPVTITFNGNGGTLGKSYTEDPKASVAYDGTDDNKSYTIPSASANYYTRNGYSFAGWATSESATAPTYTLNGETATTIQIDGETEDITLYAVWEKNKYDVTFVVDGVETVQNLEYGETPSYGTEDPTKAAT
ncbi:MAG: BspA family leucine-rich repeat surface protein, partial [Bacteroidales bacterium]|nr:BspA family leucine-rich repeat surface protein [Bacteroidales bacterium]